MRCSTALQNSMARTHARLKLWIVSADWAPGRKFIPVIVTAFEDARAAAPLFVLVDAPMRKRAIPENQRNLAPLVIGLGPGFVAGAYHC
jgi:hypothetical protein